MKTLLWMFGIWFTCLSLQAAAPRVLPKGELPKDARLGTLRHLRYDYFPFQKVSSPKAWEKRADELRRQVKVANGIWPLPTRTPLNAVVHSPVERDDYTVWRVYFESFPGHFVTGSLYRPKHVSGRLPAVLSPHGHWAEGRFHGFDDAKLKQQIAIGAERFLAGGRHPVQARCVQLARMGCVVFQYDMEGYADSVQRSAHRHDKREHMNTATNWGLNSPQAELHLQNLMGIQTWNSIRALDFLTSLEDVDPKRVVVTGSSGGGTQTFILMAVDDRPVAAIPCVMVSTAMQGGCRCENAPYLRIGAGNIDLAALTAPRPLALTAADDWTVELRTKGYPDLLALYKMLGKKDSFRAVFHTEFKHNYNSVNRTFMYGCVNDFLGLGFEKPILEEDYLPLTREEQSVWTSDHPKPSGDQAGEAHERAVLRWWTKDSSEQIAKLRDDPAAYQQVVGGAWDVLIGRQLDEVGFVDAEVAKEVEFGDYSGIVLMLKDADFGSLLPAMVLTPGDNNNGQVVLWLSDNGKSGLLDAEGKPNAEISSLLEDGYIVVGVDLLYQGEFLSDDKPLTSARLNPLDQSQADKNREPWEFFFGYNSPLFSQRVHDALTTIRAIQLSPLQASQIHLVGQGREAGAIALAAAVQAGDALDKTAIATAGFSFAAIDRKDDPMFLPGAVKYDGVEGLKRLLGDSQLWFNDQESVDASEIVTWLKK